MRKRDLFSFAVSSAAFLCLLNGATTVGIALAWFSAGFSAAGYIASRR